MTLPQTVHVFRNRFRPQERDYSTWCLRFYSPSARRVITPTAGFSTAEGTWLTWIKDLGTPDWCNYLSISLNANNRIQMTVSNTSDIYIASFSGGGWQGFVPPAGTGNIRDGLWHRIALTFSAANNRARLYMNAWLVASRVGWAGFAVPATFEIGTYTGGFGCTARQDGVCVLNRELTPQEVLEDSLRSYLPRMTGQVLRMRMEEGQGLTTRDESGQGNNGTLLPVVDPPAWVRVAKYEQLMESGK